MIDKDALRRHARELGADLAGYVTLERLSGTLPPEADPTLLAEGMRGVVVFARRSLRGIVWSRHLATKQFAGGHSHRALERLGIECSKWLQVRGHPSVPVPSGWFDFEQVTPLGVTPAGQGSLLLRHAAVAAGLGTWGLNWMVLTPQFGPRVYFGGLLTTLALEDDAPLDEELCPGLEACGRCAAVCPEDAIPRSAPRDAPLDQIRGLDCQACARSSQPFGFSSFVEHFSEILDTDDPQEMWQRTRVRRTGEAWAEMTMMKEAAMTGCSDCVQVCPIGDDYTRISGSPHRRQDLPESLPKTFAGDRVTIEHLGPRVRRKTTWDRKI